MKRRQLVHVLRVVSAIADGRDVVIVGSQAILGGVPEDRLPAAVERIKGWLRQFKSV